MIKEAVKAFLVQYTTAHAGDALDSSDMISKAVAYAMALALSNVSMHSQMASIIVPPPVPPATGTVGLPTFGVQLSAIIMGSAK